MEREAQQPGGEERDRAVICPFCGSGETEPHALFGSLLLMTQHYCRSCHTVFERVRDEGAKLDNEWGNE